MSKTTHYELNTPIGSEVLSVMTALNPNFTAIDGVMYENETRSTQALNKANVNEQNIATALGRITTAEGDIDTLESGLETVNTNISGLTSRMGTAETNIVSANNRIQENAGEITQIKSALVNKTEIKFGNFTAISDINGNIYPEFTINDRKILAVWGYDFIISFFIDATDLQHYIFHLSSYSQWNVGANHNVTVYYAYVDA